MPIYRCSECGEFVDGDFVDLKYDDDSGQATCYACERTYRYEKKGESSPLIPWD